MEIQKAKAAVELLMLQLAIKSGDVQEGDGTKVEVVLWESPHPAAGIRVAEISFTRSVAGGMCGSSWMQGEIEGLRACAAVERCILARVVLLDDEEVADADFNLSELFRAPDTKGVEVQDSAQKRYVRFKGTRCPFCDSTDIVGQSVNIDGGGASQEVGCSACDREWIDLYQLVGFKDEG